MTTPLPILSSPPRIAEPAPPRASLAQHAAKTSRTSFKDTLAGRAPIADAPEAAPIAADEVAAGDARPPAESTEESRPRAEGGRDAAKRGGEAQNEAARPTSDNAQTPARETGEASPQRAADAPRPAASVPAQQAAITAQGAPGLPDIAPPEQTGEGQASPTGGEKAESSAPAPRPAPTPTPAPAPIDMKVQAPAPVSTPSAEAPADASSAASGAVENDASAEKVEPWPMPRVSPRPAEANGLTTSPSPANRSEGAASATAPRPETAHAVTPMTAADRSQTDGVRAEPVQSPESEKDSGGERSAPRASLPVAGEGRSSPSLAPAAARAAQVNAAVRLENLAAQVSADGSTDGLSARGARPTLITGAGLKAAGAAAAGSLFAPEADGEGDFAGRIVRGLSAMVSQRGGVMTMRLHPPELGSLRVQMSIIQGTVSAQFTATTEHAQMLLERNLTSLQNALQSNGLTVDKLGVHLAGADSSSAARQETDAQSQQHHHQQGSEHDAAGRESRGRRDGERPAFHRPGAAPADFAASLDGTGGAEPPFTETTSFGAESP